MSLLLFQWTLDVFWVGPRDGREATKCAMVKMVVGYRLD